MGTTELVNEKMHCCRLFEGVVENVQKGVSIYENRKSDRGGGKKLSTILEGRFYAKSDFSTELSTMSTKIDRKI